MPKTRDAFAMRRLVDGLTNSIPGDEWFGMLPSYSERKEHQLTGLYNWEDEIEGCLLQCLDGGAVKFVGEYRGLAMTKEMLELIKARILTLRETCARLDRHIVRLQKLERAIFSKILSDGLNSSLQSKGTRVKNKLECYDWVLRLFNDYEKILWQDWRAADKEFDRLLRKGIGERLRQARVDRKLSIEEVSRRLQLSRTGYGYYELGQRDMPTPTIYRLAEMLDVSIDWLFGLKE